MTATRDDKSNAVSDERIAKLIQRRYDHCERVCECVGLGYYGED